MVKAPLHSTGAVRVNNDALGTAVALQGDTALIGTPGHDGPDFSAGAAIVWTRSRGVWTEQEALEAAAAEAIGQLGLGVALDGDTALVGGSGTTASTAYYFTRDASRTWDGGVALSVPDSPSAVSYGQSVALDNGTVVIGAFRDPGRRARPGRWASRDCRAHPVYTDHEVVLTGGKSGGSKSGSGKSRSKGKSKS